MDGLTRIGGVAVLAVVCGIDVVQGGIIELRRATSEIGVVRRRCTAAAVFSPTSLEFCNEVCAVLF